MDPQTKSKFPHSGSNRVLYLYFNVQFSKVIIIIFELFFKIDIILPCKTISPSNSSFIILFFIIFDFFNSIFDNFEIGLPNFLNFLKVNYILQNGNLVHDFSIVFY